MHLLPFLYPALFTFFLTPLPSAFAAKTPKDAILLSNVKSLTLRQNSKTSHRRVSAIPQLTCKGPACKHYQVDIMRCVNAGSDYNAEDIQWSCSASIPEEFKLGSTDVICEGYSSPDDEFVLKGSCGVEYRLLYTDAGEEKYGSGSWFSGSSSKGDDEGWTLDGILFTILFVAIAVWILWSICVGARDAPAARRRAPPRNHGGGGWGGGGGGDDPWDPPPPYPGKRYGSQSAEQGWRPGFWSGALGGAAAGYAAGRAGQRQQEARNTGWFGGGNSGGWGGGNAGSNWASPSRSSNSGSSSSARHESTGFGSTSRR